VIKVDLHTHSVASPDGSLTLADYRAALEHGKLDAIAITDHNTINFALAAQKELGDAIIVGEEIDTQQGEIIGLYLTQAVPSGLGITEAVQAITKQGGLVYIPHPFEKIRHGVSEEALDSVAGDVAILETFNGRATSDKYRFRAVAWVALHKVATAASSDAHGKIGWGRTYISIEQKPMRDTLVNLLRNGQLHRKKVGLFGLLYPKFNRLRKRGNSHA
jgi:predicted metal-dependent phosphoesterase TrpH